MFLSDKIVQKATEYKSFTDTEFQKDAIFNISNIAYIEMLEKIKQGKSDNEIVPILKNINNSWHTAVKELNKKNIYLIKNNDFFIWLSEQKIYKVILAGGFAEKLGIPTILRQKNK